jgi:GNAT superfamily N-acetyltransferase
MSDPLITPATPADVPALNQLVNSAYRGDSSRQGWTTEADLLGGIRTSEASLHETLAQPNATILAYKADGQLLGCVYLDVRGNNLYLGMLTVAPTRQAGGIGRHLLEEAEAYARTQSCCAVMMTVISQRHELIAWYERRGYHRTGETQPFPMNDPRFGEPKTQLEFIVMEKAL